MVGEGGSKGCNLGRDNAAVPAAPPMPREVDGHHLAQGPKVRMTLCWREMDSNFQYASAVRWYRATDLALPSTVKWRSAGRPPPMARPRSEAQKVP